MSAWPSDEVVAESVDRLFAEMLGHMPEPLAAELRDHLPEVEWSDAGAVETLSGQLMFTVPSLRRGYRLHAGAPREGPVASRVLVPRPLGPLRG